MNHHERLLMIQHQPRLRSRLIGVAALGLALYGLAGCGDDSAGPELALTAALPKSAPSGTVLRMGDPEIEAAMKASGLDKQLESDGIDMQWANLSGGPQTIQAFRGDKLDCGAVADIPSLFAAWTDTSTKIVSQEVRKDPLDHPIYELGIAPGSSVTSLADLKGKKIAYSPGQAQGALVLRVLKKAGLSKSDVDLVEMTSTDDTYVTALGSKAVDVAPISEEYVKEYQAKYPTGSLIKTGIRDDAATLYCLSDAVEHAHTAAALADYVRLRTKAWLWINAHPAAYAKAYYQDVEGLSAADAARTVAQNGKVGIPATWDNATARLQATADLLSREQGHDKLDVKDLEDFRFEKIESAAAGSQAVKGAAA